MSSNHIVRPAMPVETDRHLQLLLANLGRLLIENEIERQRKEAVVSVTLAGMDTTAETTTVKTAEVPWKDNAK